jgi:hypothetical protein
MPRRKPKNRGGRPTVMTPEVIADLAIALKSWRSPGLAAQQVGIGESTCWRWARQARAGDPRFAWMLPLLPKPEERPATWWF